MGRPRPAPSRPGAPAQLPEMRLPRVPGLSLYSTFSPAKMRHRPALSLGSRAEAFKSDGLILNVMREVHELNALCDRRSRQQLLTLMVMVGCGAR